MKIFRFATLASAGAVLLATSTGAFGQTADDALSQAAHDLSEQGARAAAAQKWEICRAKMLAAWALKKDAPIAAQLGECELKAGHPRDAAEHLQSFLDGAPATTTAELRKHAAALLDEAKAKIAVVSVVTPFAGTEVYLEGKSIGKAPLTVYLDPGHYAFEGRSEGHPVASMAIDVAAGSSPALDLAPAPPPATPMSLPMTPAIPATPPAAAAPAAPATAPTAPTPPTTTPAVPTAPTTPVISTKRLVPLLLAGGALAVFGVGIGIENLVLSGSDHDDAVTLSRSIRSGGGYCGTTPKPGFEASCGKLQALTSSRDSTRTLGVGGLAVGGLAAGLTIGGLFWGGILPSSKSKHALVVAPLIGATGGVVASGTF